MWIERIAVDSSGQAPIGSMSSRLAC